jgi:two-component system cell cycle response regulator
MLKVQLSAAYYRVVQGERLTGALATAARVQPDLILTAMTLGDGDACALVRALRADEGLASVPVFALAPQNDRAARLRALGAGVDDVLCHPLDDLMLRARIRSLLRSRSLAEELRPRDGEGRLMGMAEPMASFAPAARIAVLAPTPATGALWRSRLAPMLPGRLTSAPLDDLQSLIRGTAVPDAFVLGLNGQNTGAGLRLLADLRAHGHTRDAAIIAVPDHPNAGLAADALDLGADDAMPGGFQAEELALRLKQQLQRKRQRESWRDDMRQGLRAALRDPLTGLFNRRYALPHLARTARNASAKKQSFAVMLADLDHFKRINDTHGHLVGDRVLVETATRLRNVLRSDDMLARVGGEEFMVVLPDTEPREANKLAERLRQAIHAEHYKVDGVDRPIAVTTSIGLTVTSPGTIPVSGQTDSMAQELMGQADKALYAAKGAGRNQVSWLRGAA